MQDSTPPYVDRSGGSAMHRDRDARREARHSVPADARAVLFDEELLIPRALLPSLDMRHLAEAGWAPLSRESGLARIVAIRPDDPAVAEDARRVLGADHVETLNISPEDLARLLANNEDVNPGFPPEANRTSLARVRTHLADRRSLLASRRTTFAKGRTGLAMFRTGLAMTTGLLLLLRIASMGWTSPVELFLLVAGLFLVIDGLRWYLPARRLARRGAASGLPPANPTGVLTATMENLRPVFRRVPADLQAGAARKGWDGLTPVMRRRFLALDRTNLAEERTLLAFLRTLMAKSRTGMALGRTGVALAGIGSALIRQYHRGDIGDPGWALIAIGALMTLEGLSWYLPGRAAGKRSMDATAAAEAAGGPWGLMRPAESGPDGPETRDPRAGVQDGTEPGVWGSTGLALERTLLAERRNVMARLRTHMARARTGLSFIRTGMNFTAVGLGLLASFGFASVGWTTLEGAVLALGVLLVADGLYWYLPADRTRRSLPYCYHGLEIALPDYSRPVGQWPRTEFDDAAD